MGTTSSEVRHCLCSPHGSSVLLLVYYTVYTVLSIPLRYSTVSSIYLAVRFAFPRVTIHEARRPGAIRKGDGPALWIGMRARNQPSGRSNPLEMNRLQFTPQKVVRVLIRRRGLQGRKMWCRGCE